jgi:subtilisin family serine protease
MNMRRSIRTVILLTTLWSHPLLASAREYSLTVGGDRLVFAPQADVGYVVAARQKAGSISIASNALGPLASGQARPMGGSDRHGMWVVEDRQSAGETEKTIGQLRREAQIRYAAPLFSCQGQTVAIIPEVVVRAAPSMNVAELQDLCESVGCRIKERMEFTAREYLLEVLGPDAASVFAAVDVLSRSAGIEWACPNIASQPKPCGPSISPDRYAAPWLPLQNVTATAGTSGVFPNDEYLPSQWYLLNTGQSGGVPGADIRASEAWEITTGDPSIVVAVLDSGVDLDHPDLVNNLVPGYDFYDHDDVPEPSEGDAFQAHGTACAGLVAAQGGNAIGVAGVTWHCGLMPLRAYLWGDWGTTPQSDVATALRWAAAHGADVLSNSWGEKVPLPIIRSALVDVTRPGGIGREGKGCVVLFASGNESGPMLWPAQYAEVIAVGATDKTDRLLSYSSRGPELDVVAPSGPLSLPSMLRGDIWATDTVGPVGWGNRDPRILDYTDSFGGTSAACPIAAGIAALILSIEPNLTSEEVRHFLERSAKDLGDPGRDDYYGWGRVDARAALDLVLAKRADLNNDWIVDANDLTLLTTAMKTGDRSADIAPAAKRDGIVDAKDRELLMQYWQTRIPEMTEPGLVAHWKFDETQGEIAQEGINRRDGSLQGGPSWRPTEGKVGGALALDGVDDYLKAEYVPRFPAEPFSVFAWVQGGAPGQVILSQQKVADWLMVGSDGKLTTGLKSAGRSGKPLAAPVLITDGAWHRVGLVWDGSNRILYVDNVEVARDTQSNLAGLPIGLYFGTGATLAPGSFWSGLIDDVRIYDRVVQP